MGEGMSQTDAFPISTPEQQGMSSQPLLTILRSLIDHQKGIHSLLIVRNGYLVVEAYFDPYRENMKHHLASASKSITSMLIGIAGKQGHIRSVAQQAVEFLPEMRTASRHPKMLAITLEHLLTMTTGIRWHESDRTYWSAHNTLTQMIRQESWLEFLFRQPMESEPGAQFNYNSGASHLLSAVVQRVTGVTAAAYAAQYLFHPLGIVDYHWLSDPTGITAGHCCLYLTPRDMAKLGCLYLQNGQWKGQEIVPATWVAESTRRHRDFVSRSSSPAALLQRLSRLRRRESTRARYGYGYQWIVPPFGGYATRGVGGQAIFVIPALNMVAVFTGGLPKSDRLLPEKLMERYIVPAAMVSEPFSEQRAASDALNKVLQEVARPPSEPVSAQPAMATRISGITYTANGNAIGIQWLSFAFSQDNTADLTIALNNTVYHVSIGLDNVYRVNPLSQQPALALKGRWKDANTFRLDWLQVEAGTRYEIDFTFQGNEFKAVSHGVTGGAAAKFFGQTEV